MIKKIILLSAITGSLFVAAQKSGSYTVVKGDNPYSIAKKLGISHEELLRLNPKAKSGTLAIGDVLSVPSKKSTVAKTTPVASQPMQAGTLVVGPKQTIYGLTRQYHISETELRKLNPQLKDLQIGDTIVLPLQSLKKYGQSATSAPVQATPIAQDDLYTVQPKDNYYRITKQFGVTQDQLYKMNPGLEVQGLQPGAKIRVKGNSKDAAVQPVVQKTEQYSAPAAVADDYVTYTVVQGDTAFSIINRFGITMDSLISLNPELSNGLKPGMILKIKKVDSTFVKKNIADGLNVVLLLPFGFDSNESKFRSQAFDFLSGAKLAAERNAALGQKININVIDSGNESVLKNTLTQINQDNTDLIIGPFLKSNVIETLEYVKGKKIPLVAPFANAEELYGYSNLLIVEPNDRAFADKIITETASAYTGQKIYILADSGKTYANYIKAGLEKSLSNPTVIIVNSASDIQADKNMMTGQDAPIIAILANSDDTAGNAFTSRIIDLTRTTAGIRAFSMYYAPIFDKKKDELSQANMVYIMDRMINKDGDFEKEILAEFRKKYCMAAPSKFAVVGFDVMNDMLSRENKNGEIFKQIGKTQTQLATKFQFERTSPNGAYINTGYRLIRLQP